jgi:hypothetical protein
MRGQCIARTATRIAILNTTTLFRLARYLLLLLSSCDSSIVLYKSGGLHVELANLVFLSLYQKRVSPKRYQSNLFHSAGPAMRSGSYELMTCGYEASETQELLAIGVPAKKPQIRALDLVVLVASLGCCSAAITILQVERLAWLLGYQYQLVVIGVMLSMMNVCLSYSRTYFFTLMEARFGRSTLQNYDAILQNAIFSPQTTVYWRVAIFVLWLLPIGLSIAYKVFPISTVSAQVHYSEPVDFGFYPPLGLERTGLGVALLANTSLPFIQASHARFNYSTDPLEPFRPGTFGANTLVISNTAVAIVDLPNPQFVAYARRRLHQGESWRIRAEILATVTRQNITVDQYRDPDDQSSVSFWKEYESHMYTRKCARLFNQFKLCMGNNQNFDESGDQTWLFLAIQPDLTDQPDATELDDQTLFHSTARMFATWREPCIAEWSISQTTMQLVNGACDAISIDGLLDASNQEMFTKANLALDVYFLPSLSEFLGAFAVERNSSEWLLPTMTASVASMMYSRVTAINPPEDGGLPHLNYTTRGEMTITSKRPALRQSKGLLLVILVQPTLLVLCMIATWLLYSVPVDRTLGLVSILAGVDRSSLQHLSGASLSSRLRREIRLGIAVQASGEMQTGIHYTVGGCEESVREPIRSGTMYG